MSRIVLAEAYRTPIGVFGGAFKDIPAYELGATVIRQILEHSQIDPNEINEVILGNVLQAGQGQNPARIAAIHGGVPEAVPSFTVNKVCGSGLKAIQVAYQSIVAGDNEIVIAGGMESMSLEDSMIADGLTDKFNDYHMGITAENLVEQYQISRKEQDQFAFDSQQKASRAQQAGVFDAEIVPVEVPQRKGDPLMISQDEGIRPQTTIEKLAQLRPAFKKDGSVTAGNASGINDGAAAMLVMTEDKAKELGIQPIAVLDSFGASGVAPSIMGIGPVEAIRKALKRSNKVIDDVDIFELNEAFAAQSIAVNRELQLPQDKVNVNGGAIALGHPIGASGARTLVSLLHQLSDAKPTGVASLCIGGGQGIATLVSKYGV